MYYHYHLAGYLDFSTNGSNEWTLDMQSDSLNACIYINPFSHNDTF